MISRLAIVGPTAVGKTALAISLAQRFDGELINADSRQVLRDVSVATGKPTRDELAGISCHCIDLWGVGEVHTVHDWLQHARAADDDIRRRGKLAIVVGGTGLYVTSLIRGFRDATEAVDRKVRAQRQRQIDAGNLRMLVDELARRDPEATGAIDTHNPRRVIRALELLDHGFSSLAEARQRHDPRPALTLVLDLPQEEYDSRVRERVEAMFSDALLEEIALLRGQAKTDDAIAGCGIGYAEALRWIDGDLKRDQAIAAAVGRTHQYATSQRTWWRSQEGTLWIDAKHTFA